MLYIPPTQKPLFRKNKSVLPDQSESSIHTSVQLEPIGNTSAWPIGYHAEKKSSDHFGLRDSAVHAVHKNNVAKKKMLPHLL